ncbi:hypothetical protein EVAR_68244_1 [Eumeta japonica]|uniref:Uncharacterized protein n=1 Tax=Eumeta variegata TaxID=151549 RepID=A0A4C2A2U4_EUMVA|nr:hypothetical protein EVAR_68244_1 [Eumeta japonica]
MVEEKGWMRKKAIWTKLTDTDLQDFPRLTWDELRQLTIGIYQLKQSQSYTQEHLNEEGMYSIYIHREDDSVLRVQLRSRHTSSKNYNIWIKTERSNISHTNIQWYCQCKSTNGVCEDGAAPAPPVRGSSMRCTDLDARFADFFRPVANFPLPDHFRGIPKGYSSTTVTGVKAQAPLPPLSVALDGWSAPAGPGPDAHPAHALLSAAHALLRPASAIAVIAPNPASPAPMLSTDALPIDEVTLPEADVTDLHDVVDAINRLCDTMTFSTYEGESETIDAWHECVEPVPAAPRVPPVPPPRSPRPTALAPREEPRAPNLECEIGRSNESGISTLNLEPFFVLPGSTGSTDAYIDFTVCTSIESSRSCEGVSEREAYTPPSQPERPPSELYYTASSEVSLVSDVTESPASLAATAIASGRSECIVAGHVAAMRERFESMTRTNTPCPGTERTASPVTDGTPALIASTDQLF